MGEAEPGPLDLALARIATQVSRDFVKVVIENDEIALNKLIHKEPVKA